MRSCKLHFSSLIRNVSQCSTRCADGDLIGLKQRVLTEGQQNGPSVDAAQHGLLGRALLQQRETIIDCTLPSMCSLARKSMMELQP